MDGRTGSHTQKVPRCGEAFENPIPEKTDINQKSHWTTILDSFREADEKQCAVWKDEVNTLLIFAGLFSAVITAFLIESYKFLQPPDQTTAALHRLSEKLEMLALSIRSDTPLSPSLPPVEISSPSTQNVRINILWFSSLVLSLATVVIGIIALQWLRSHQWYYDNMSPKSSLGVYRMRQSAKDAWNLQGVFTSLPLLILVALVLFFVGLVDFLVALNHTVAVPVGVFAYGTLAILFITTVLPSFQIFKLQLFVPINIPTPCPYKSPQSWIFHRFCTGVIHGVRSIMRHLRRHEFNNLLLLSDAPLYYTVYSSPRKWTEYDQKWVRLRDVYAGCATGTFQRNSPYSSVSLEHSRKPIYDEVFMLVHAITVQPSAEVLFAAYHCFWEISKNALFQDIETKEDYADPRYNERNRILRSYCWRHISLPISDEKPQPRFGPPISDLVQNPSAHLLHDENMMVFLKMHGSHNLPEEASPVISAHLSELQARILAYAYAAQPDLHIQVSSGEDAKESRDSAAKFQWLLMMSQQYIDMINSTNSVPKFKIWWQFSPSSLNGNEVSVSSGTITKTIIWHSTIFEQFVQQVAESPYLDWEETIYAHRDVAQFLKVPAAMLRYTGSHQIPFDCFSRFKQSFDVIQAALSSPSTSDPDDIQSLGEMNTDQTNADYLFLTACFLVDQLFNPYAELPLEPFNPDQCERMADFIKALHVYEEANYPPARIQENWVDLWSDTGLPKEPRFDCMPAPTRRSYIRWKAIPKWIDVDLISSQTDR